MEASNHSVVSLQDRLVFGTSYFLIVSIASFIVTSYVYMYLTSYLYHVMYIIAIGVTPATSQPSTLAHLSPALQPIDIAHQPQIPQVSHTPQQPPVTALPMPQSSQLPLTSTVSRKLKLFISYGREEVTNTFAKRLHGDLENKGYQPTLDAKSFEIGDSLSHVISQGIANCDAMIVILSKKYSKSSWCNDELIFAKKRNKKIFIIKCEKECNLSDQVDYQIGDSLYLSVTQDEEYDEEIVKLMKALEKVNL